jgi:uncharacterized protein (DUF697 family)
MTRKQLPKAITRATAERHEADADEIVGEEPAPKPRRRAPARRPADQAEQAAESKSDATVESAPEKTEPMPLTGEVLPPEASRGRSASQGKERRGAAEKIVDRYRIYAGLGGLVPMPAINVAGVTAINLRMIKALCDVYELPFDKNQTRSIIMGVIGGSVPTGIGIATASLVGLILPAGAFVGLAASAASAAAVTRGIGLLFIEYFENGAMPEVAPKSAPAQEKSRDT